MGYLMVAAFPVFLWVLSNRLTGITVLTVSAVLVVIVRRALKLIRCFYRCGGFTFDIGGRVRIMISQPCVDDPC